MKRDGYRIEELSHELLMKFTIDTLGRCVDVQYPDSLGGVRFNPTQRSRELLNTALSELNPSPRHTRTAEKSRMCEKC